MIPSLLSITCLKKVKEKKHFYVIQADTMKNSRIDSVALNGKRPLKIKPNHGWMIILLRRRVKKLMNMNEQPETQLAEPKEERTRFPLC